MRKTTCLLAAAILAAVPAMAGAAEGREGLYGLAGLQRYQFEDKGEKSGAAKRDAWKGNASGISIGGGVRLSPNLAVEGGYRGTPRGVKRAGVGSYSTQTVDASVLAIAPLGSRVEVFARAGAGYVRNSLKPVSRQGGVGARRDSMLVARLGLGGDVHLTDKTFIRAEVSALRPRKTSGNTVFDAKKKWQGEGIGLSIGHRF